MSHMSSLEDEDQLCWGSFFVITPLARVVQGALATLICTLSGNLAAIATPQHMLPCIYL